MYQEDPLELCDSCPQSFDITLSGDGKLGSVAADDGLRSSVIPSLHSKALPTCASTAEHRFSWKYSSFKTSAARLCQSDMQSTTAHSSGTSQYCTEQAGTRHHGPHLGPEADMCYNVFWTKISSKYDIDNLAPRRITYTIVVLTSSLWLLMPRLTLSNVASGLS